MSAEKIAQLEQQLAAINELEAEESAPQGSLQELQAQLAAIEELEAEEAPFVDRAAATVGAAGEAVDAVTGAPTRAATMALIQGKGLGGAAESFGQQFGADTQTAPTGQEIVEAAGLPTEQEQRQFEQNIGAAKGTLDMPNPYLSVFGAAAPIVADVGEALGFEGAKVPVSQYFGTGAEMALDPLNLGMGAVTQPIKIGKKIIKTTKRVRGIPGSVNHVKAAEKASSGVVGDIAKGAKETIEQRFNEFFRPTRAENADELLEIAKREGIDPDALPEAVEFGKDSGIGRMERSLRQMSQGRADKVNDAIDNISTAANNAASEIGGGKVLTSSEAGALIREGHDGALRRVLDDATTTYSSIVKNNPGLTLGDTAGFTKQIDSIDAMAGKGLNSLDGVTRKQAAQLKQAIKRLREAGESGDLESLVGAMQDVGQVAYKKKFISGEVPPDVERMRKLYDITREQIYRAVESGVPGGAEIVTDLKKNNKILSEFFGNKSKISRTMGQADDATLFNSLVVNGDKNKIDALKEILSPDEFQQLKGAFIDSKLKFNQDGDLLFRSSSNNFRNLEKKKQVVSSMLDEGEAKRINDILDLGDSLGPKLNPSGTAELSSFQNLKQTVQSIVVNESMLNVMKKIARGKKATRADADIIGGVITAREAKDILGAAENIDNLDKVDPKTLDRITGVLSKLGAKGRADKLPLKKVQLGKAKREPKIRTIGKALQVKGARDESERRQRK